MQHKFFTLLMLALMLTLGIKAQWISIDPQSAAGTDQKVSVLKDTENETVIRVDLSGFMLKDLIQNGQTFQTADLLTDIFTTQVGFPELPQIAKILAVPDQAGLSVEIVETGQMRTFSNINIPAARESWWEGAKEPAYTNNGEAYKTDAFYPAEYASLDEPSVFRDFRIARLSVYPMRYNPATKELQVVSSVTVKISYGKGEVINPKTSPRRPIVPSYGKIYAGAIFNYKEVLNRVYDGREEGHDLMLCIMPDEFVESFQVYADWNRQTGTDIHITSFSDIGANSSNPDIIKNHITDAYFNWSTIPTYVLIVGDDGVFPKKIISYPDYSFPYDNYFVNVEGGDHFPEMMIGRFTNQGDYRMRVMINKYQLYEQFPYTEETDWFKKAVCCSNNAYESQVETKRFAYECMTEDGGFSHVDTLMSDGNGWNCSMDVDDIINAIEDGRSYLNYRGEGWNHGWYASCYDFYSDHVGNIQNGQKFTFVTSIGCGVAMFDASGGNCFGEEWIQMGTIGEPRGGIAFIGPTSNTHTTYNNRIDKGIYTGMFREGLDTPGQALERGKLYMYNVFGTDPYVAYHYNVFHVLGDPSLHIWKDVPLEVNVDHVDVIPVGNNQLEITVNFAASGLPADSAMVIVTNNEIFAKAWCDVNGVALIDIIPSVEDTLVVTVRGGNVYPHQSIIEIIQPDELVEPEGLPEMVDMNGNNDGLLNPAEDCQVAYTLKNWGDLVVNNVQATLTCTDPMVEIVNGGPVNYGSLQPGGELIGDPFMFHVDALCPIDHIITLTLNVSSSLSSWEYNAATKVMGCHLNFDNYMVGDEGSSNMNYRMDPGETVRLFLSVVNNGDDLAPNVSGLLSSSDPYITITDETATFGTLEIDGQAINTDDYFELTIDAACPSAYMAEFSLNLFTEDGFYPYQIDIVHQFPIALPVPTDYTGPDAYGYYAYSSNDAFYDQIPEYDWMEVSGVGEMLNMFGETDYTETVDLPFSFKYYGFDYDKLRISTDGWIAFGNGVQTAPMNYSLPHNDNVSNMVAVFWDDLYDTQFADGHIFYHYDMDNHRFIVEWDSITHNNAGPEPIREEFQAILLDPDHYQTLTGDGEIIMQYRKMEDMSGNTIGIENQSQDIGLQYVYNQNYNPTATTITNGIAVKFTTEAPFVSSIVSIDDYSTGFNNNSGLLHSTPNPFAGSTLIGYTLPKDAQVVLEVYNIRGERVGQLLDALQVAGKHEISWNGQNTARQDLPEGVYFVRIQTPDFAQTMKMIKLN